MRYNDANHFSLPDQRILIVDYPRAPLEIGIVLLGQLLALCISHFDLFVFDLFSLFLPFLFLHLFFIVKILLEEEQYFILVAILHGLLKAKHLVANIVANLNGLVLVLEFLPATILKDHLALFIRALVLLAPLLMLSNI